MSTTAPDVGVLPAVELASSFPLSPLTVAGVQALEDRLRFRVSQGVLDGRFASETLRGWWLRDVERLREVDAQANSFRYVDDERLGIKVLAR